MIVLKPAEMAKIDQMTIDSGYPALLLMEAAGRGTAELIHEIAQKNLTGRFADNSGVNGSLILGNDFAGGFANKESCKNILIFCGSGNNGGDGLAIGRYLDMWGYRVTIVLMREPEKFSTISLKNYQLCSQREINLHGITELSVDSLKNLIRQANIIVDALLGTGIKGQVRGKIAEIIKLINNNKSPESCVVAVDIPTGIAGDSGRVLGQAVQADYTVTMAFLKTGLCLYPGREYAGKIKIVDIGIPQEIVNKAEYNHYCLSDKQAITLLPIRPPTGHKGTFGRVLVVGGSPGMSGAPYLAGIAALMMGAGLVKLAVPRTIQPVVAAYREELMTAGLRDNNQGIIKKALPEIKELAESADVVIIGPGLGRRAVVGEVVKEILLAVAKPLIVDADGLNVLADRDDGLTVLKNRQAPTILTPHPGEMARLLPGEINEIEEHRLKVTTEFATNQQINLVFKGAVTAIGLPAGNVYLNPTGNNGLATAGSGDVLAGIIGGLIAQGLSAQNAAILGPYLHGFAGDIAVGEYTENSLTARMIVEHLSEVLKRLTDH